MIRKSARQLAFCYNCIGPIDVAQPIPPQALAAAASSRSARRGGDGWKAPLRISTPDEPEDEIVEEESDEDVDVYLNTVMFTVRKC
jgi:hypothetical protein